jgi:hypothetical protein
MVSISSTTSPITPGPTEAATHNSSMVQKHLCHFFYALLIPTWCVAELEFECFWFNM